ncbi:MAG: radical SAM protein [Candidatus Aenigmatarchaeota archaeon]
MEKILEDTESICPKCFKEGRIHKIKAHIVEEDNKIWLKKKCIEHGDFKSIVFSDAKLYYKWMKYKVIGKGPTYKSIKNETKGVDSTPYSKEKLYPEHCSQSVLTNLLVTNRCNLRCPYCFMNAGAAGYVYEPSLDDIRKILRQARDEKPVPSKAIQITGGEPTIRDDLVDIIKISKELGFTHIQLNTNSIKMSESLEYCKKIIGAGVNTVYMSFDGVSEDTNPWINENKKAIDNLRKIGFSSVVLVPVVMKRNLHEMPEIIKYAVENIDVVRGVNFQPVSFCGRLQNITEEIIEKEGVDYAELFGVLEDGLDGQIKKDDFYPVPFVYPISKLAEVLKGKEQVEFTANPMCGAATYVFISDSKIIPITRFVDVEGLMTFIKEQSKTRGLLTKPRIALSFIRNIDKFIDKEKSPIDLKKILIKAIIGGTYNELRQFHYKSLYIGSMWFQDPWNINIERLKMCVIHYATFEGIVPFCAYNGLGVGEEIRRRHSIPISEWEKREGKRIEDDLWKRV